MNSYEEGSFQASKTMTVTRMATPRGPIPVTVDTFEASGGPGGGGIPRGGVGTRSADAYRECGVYTFGAQLLEFVAGEGL